MGRSYPAIGVRESIDSGTSSAGGSRVAGPPSPMPPPAFSGGLFTVPVGPCALPEHGDYRRDRPRTARPASRSATDRGRRHQPMLSKPR
jgi:hypothetical protein